jgi:uncharacterized membrane protein YraQ (UPF0718 family)/YHS domain-containing protein
VNLAGLLTDIGHSLRESFAMLWETLWALVVGFALSGAIQAFVSREEMQRRLGDHRPATVARASVYGMVSSSCSYAASAMARSLIGRGADFVAAMVFLFASTNLVIELGVMLLVLIGWQFLVAEFAGGVIMILLLAAAGSLWLRGRTVVAARAAAERGSDPRPLDGALAARPWHERIRSGAGWADAATYTVSDLRMLRTELVIGFAAAGALAELVPIHVWDDVFFHGHGWLTTIENVLVGPLVAVVSFVCSVGNVPLAAALWKGGISFGGVVSFVFADLITFPLLLVYRKQYGGRMALRMLVLFWAIMALAGLVTEGLFRVLGLVPTTRPAVVAPTALRWGPTTVADLVAIAGLAGMFWLRHNRERLGGGDGYAVDPVCGMQVARRQAPAWIVADGERSYFCSERCRDRYVSERARRTGVVDSHKVVGRGRMGPDKRRRPDAPGARTP